MADLFKTQKLFRNNPETDEGGVEVNVEESLSGKIVALYFSAHWCPPCRTFTPVLNTFYEQLAGQPFEIVFVPFDRSEDDLKQYLKENHGKWLYMKLDDPYIKELSQKYQVSGIPSLIVVKSDGEVIDEIARNKVQSVDEATTAVQVFEQWKSASSGTGGGGEAAVTVTTATEDDIFQ